MEKKNNLMWIYSIPMQNFLEEYGIFPEIEDVVSSAAGYKNTEKIRKVLERYYIQNCLIKNKL